MTQMLNLIRITSFTTMLNSRHLQKGDQIIFNFRLENISDSIINNICIYKQWEQTYSGGISIKPGCSETISTAYLITKADEQAGIIRNTSVLSATIITGEIISETLTGLHKIN